MKKSSIFLVFCLLFALFACGCNEKGIKAELYLDRNEPIIIGDVEFQISSIYERASDNNYLYFNYKIRNISDETKRINIKNASITRASNNVTYGVDLTGGSTRNFNLESGLTKSFRGSAVIPTSYEKDNYYIDFTINNSILRVYLYDTPDELRETLTVSYFIDNALVHTENVLEGRKIEDYIWESSDGVYYCTNWKYTGSDEKYYDDGTLKDDIELFGSKQPILRYSTTSSDKYTIVWGENYSGYIPKDKVLVIPSNYLGKPTFLSSALFISIPSVINTVYIGKVGKISSFGFEYSNIKTIYFAGTKTEWEQYGVDVPDKITVYYNSPYEK